MKKIAYDEMFLNEANHAWYVATRKLLIYSLMKYTEKNTKILDVGCGTGGTIKELQKAGYKNVFGMDKEKYAIKYCKRRNIKNVRVANISALPFPENTFDAVICLDVLYHKGVNAKKAIEEMHRVVKKGGLFYSQEPAYNWLQSQHDTAVETRKRFTKRELADSFSKAGFVNLKSSYFNTLLALPIILSRIKNKLLTNDKGSDVKELSPILNVIVKIILEFEANLLKHINLPFGISIINIWKK